ncbi:MAG: hypothetical protein IPN76_02530 [Saprospiraceae bacterium]|nr:hypothetical protein [Saprospiraceae bacterium]
MISPCAPSHEYVPEAFDLGDARRLSAAMIFARRPAPYPRRMLGKIGVFMETVVGGFLRWGLFSLR